jgi:DNA polymerase V
MKNKVYSLVDANNFYASCERVFNASVHTKPIVVLSNNDSCVVARSNDIKQYVKMRQPVFEIEDVIQAHGVRVFSSNYSLYATLSARFKAVLSEFCLLQENYSIDESFLELTHLLLTISLSMDVRSKPECCKTLASQSRSALQQRSA